LRRQRRKHLGNRLGRIFLERLEDRIVPDSSGPQIISYSPSEVRNAIFDHVDVQFNETIDPNTFTVDDVLIKGPAGALASTGVSQLSPDTFRVTFDALSVRGNYTTTIGPNIADLSGNLMDQNQNGVNGEATADQFVANFVYISANIIFTTSTTVSETNLTYEDQNLLIDGTTVSIDGPHHFNSVHLVHGGVVTHMSDTATQTHKLDLSVTEQIIVDATSRIDASARGYVGGRTTGNTTTGAATQTSGGSYGGLGGVDTRTPGQTNAVYGDYANANDWGSGGATNGSGGGLIRLVADTLTLDGQVLARGQAGYASGASGGGIYIAVTTLQPLPSKIGDNRTAALG
jgi:hypothetical protein